MLFLASVPHCSCTVYEMECFESRKGVYVSLNPSHGQKVKALSLGLHSTGSRAEQEPVCYTELYEHVGFTVTE